MDSIDSDKTGNKNKMATAIRIYYESKSKAKVPLGQHDYITLNLIK